ncbi:MAG: hypothetical protein M3Z05_18015 [Gemmatimonadota bacterium]|nr:hypothetical protein [Gemmatimonadota bacterium]
MQVHRRAIFGTVLSVLSALPCVATGQTATQTVTFSVVSSTFVAIGNVAAPIRPAMQSPDRTRTGATVAGSTYAIVTNEKNQKITASIDGVASGAASLAVAMGAPRGAASRGLTRLSTTPTDVVTGISGSDGVALPMRYQWNGSAAAVAELRNRVVTYTITAGL